MKLIFTYIQHKGQIIPTCHLEENHQLGLALCRALSRGECGAQVGEGVAVERAQGRQRHA